MTEVLHNPRRRWARRARPALGALALAYIVVFWGLGCTDLLILHPSRKPLNAPAGAIRSMVTAGSYSLELLTVRPNPPGEVRATVLVLIPNAGRAEGELRARAGAWEGLPVEMVALNYPGYGNSPGKASLANIAGSAVAAFDYLRAAHPDRPIFLQSYSIGSAAALHVAAERPGQVAGLYVYAVPPLHEVLMEDKGWWNLWLIAYPVSRGVPAQMEAMRNAPRVQAPAAIVVGTRDTYVPTRLQRRVAATYAGPKLLIDLPLTHDDVPETEHLAESQRAVRWLWGRAYPWTPSERAR